MYEKAILKFMELLSVAVLKLIVVDHLHIACSAGILLGWVNLQTCNHFFDLPYFI